MSDTGDYAFVVIPAFNHGVSKQDPIVASDPYVAAERATERYDLTKSAETLDNWESRAFNELRASDKTRYWQWEHPRMDGTYHIHEKKIQTGNDG